MYPTTSSSGATTNLPIRLACKNFVQPLLLHDQRKLSRPLGSAPPGSCSLPRTDNGIANVITIARGIAGVAMLPLGLVIASTTRIARGITCVAKFALGLFIAGIPRIARGIACVARVALFIAGVVRITLGRFIPTAGTGFYSGILLEARLTKLSADARRIPTTPPEVLAFLHFQHLHCLHHLHRHHD